MIFCCCPCSLSTLPLTSFSLLSITLYSLLSTLYSSLSTLYSLLSTLYSLLFTLSTILQWPETMINTFSIFTTLSSAGSNLLIPDCELTTMRTSDAFYLKQLVFSFSAPFIVICVVIAWSTMYGIFGRRCKWSLKQLKNFIILSIVMSLFLAYPMLVKICLSMLKCVKVGEHRSEERV